MKIHPHVSIAVSHRQHRDIYRVAGTGHRMHHIPGIWHETHEVCVGPYYKHNLSVGPFDARRALRTMQPANLRYKLVAVPDTVMITLRF